MPDATVAKVSAARSCRSLILVSGIALAAGVVLYAVLRPEGLRAAAWLGPLWPSSRIWTWNSALAGCLPGGLWMLSATAFQAAIWANRPGWARQFWVLAPLAVGIAWEVAQTKRILPGTFDPLDLLAYLLGWGVAARLASNEAASL